MMMLQVPYNTRLVADLRQLMTLRQHYYPEGKNAIENQNVLENLKNIFWFV